MLAAQEVQDGGDVTGDSESILPALEIEMRNDLVGRVILSLQYGRNSVVFLVMLAAQEVQKWGHATGGSIHPSLEIALREDLVGRLILAPQH